MRGYCIISILILSGQLFAQNPDTIRLKRLDSVTIISYLREPEISRLPGINGTFIFAAVGRQESERFGNCAPVV